MESLSLLPALERLPVSEDSAGIHVREFRLRLIEMDRDHWCIEASAGVEKTLLGPFNWRNIPDDVREAHRLAFPNSVESLYKDFLDAREGGERTLTSFLSNLKGKLAEMRLVPYLEQQDPGTIFNMAKAQNQPGWDIKGVRPDGEKILVQVKSGSEEYASKVLEDIQDAPPNTVFYVCREMYAWYAEKHPEVLSRVQDIGTSNSEITGTLKDNLDTLVDNYGIDLPDSIIEILSYVGEMVLGIKLIVDMVSVERDFRDAEISDRTRVHALKALTLMSRLGITNVCMGLGSWAGIIVLPGAGSAVGGVSGVGLAIYLNQRLKPRMLEMAMKVVAISEDDMFYLRNKVKIDYIGASLAATSAREGLN